MPVQCPLAVWILEACVQRAARDRRDRVLERLLVPGNSFVKILVPLIASGIGRRVFCFMFSWVDLLLARTLTSVTQSQFRPVMTRTVSEAAWTGASWRGRRATIIPGALVIWFVAITSRAVCARRVLRDDIKISLRGAKRRSQSLLVLSSGLLASLE